MRFDRAPRRRANREPEPFCLRISELHRPYNRVSAAQRRQPRPERNDVAVAAHLDRGLWTRLHARVALPTLVGLLVPRLAEALVEHHEVVGTNVHARGAIQRLAAVAFIWMHEGRHTHLFRSRNVSLPLFDLKPAFIKGRRSLYAPAYPRVYSLRRSLLAEAPLRFQLRLHVA